ncbi:MAG: AraC family transcriptional regulator [Halioglobus sp.]|nr:AraC family transcriptional regulator [Halioglobus sp.]|tara:strand:+ start:1269 stop:1994 length:726 start_codon:yes stop_codon:yes gene_type:complete
MSKLVFTTLAGAERSFAMLDLIPDTHAWIKDSAGRFVYGNRLFFERFGFGTLQGLLGKCDFDIAPAHLAAKYVSDDDYVLDGGVVNDRLELILGEGDGGDWFLTSKWPIYDQRDQVIGTFGISRHLNRTEGTAVPLRELRAPVDYICQNFATAISVDALAAACNISVSALERRFRKHLDKTPHQYINEVRLDNARQLLLETDKPIGTIALETGFADHSHFTRTFTRHYGRNPSQLRKETRT